MKLLLIFIALIVTAVVIGVIFFLIARDDQKRKDVNVMDSAPVLVGFGIIFILMPLLAFLLQAGQ